MKQSSSTPLSRQDFDAFPWHFAETVCRLAPGGTSRAPDDLFLAAALTAQNTFVDKHVCLDLSSQIPLTVADNEEPIQFIPAAGLLDTLRSDVCSFAVALDPRPDSGAFKPLILEANRLYLQRYWLYENMLARLLKTCAAHLSEPDMIDDPQSLTKLTLDTSQTEAIRHVFANRFTVITGGPGTGKTTIVSVVLAALLKANPELNVCLCAPTGKAQARLKEALDHEINANLKLDDIPALKAKLGELKTSTIHRLLKCKPPLMICSANAENPLPADVLIVDEVSMVDLSFMVKLLTAVRETCKVILLGDSDQLAAVETGAVLAELCDASWGSKPPIVRLTKSHRFKSECGIGQLKDAVNAGDSDDAWSILHTGSSDAISHASSPATHDICERELARLLSDTQHPLRAYLKESTPHTAFPLFDSFRILCAVNNGPCGVDHVNRCIQKLLGIGDYAHGYPLMVKVNDYTHRLFNGDIGLCLRSPESGDIRVWFPDIDHPGQYRSFSQSEIPEHVSVFAMTVHKAQGSGFDNVLLVLPPNKNRILTRELVYTGLTRAKSHCAIWTNKSVFTAAVEHRTRRMSGLKDKLDW